MIGIRECQYALFLSAIPRACFPCVLAGHWFEAGAYVSVAVCVGLQLSGEHIPVDGNYSDWQVADGKKRTGHPLPLFHFNP